ncbi:MAG TPA: hypothetical protein VLT88_10305 [Desulfosarcina sp.]|nr:hypothetical protein [Desulfosarcina sp.]
MLIKKRRRGPAFLKIISERRSGIDRRVLSYAFYIPERRINPDRRQQGTGAGGGLGEWRGRRRYA